MDLIIHDDVVLIPKSVHEERIIENFDVFDFKLSPDDMENIAELNADESCSSVTAIQRW